MRSGTSLSAARARNIHFTLDNTYPSLTPVGPAVRKDAIAEKLFGAPGEGARLWTPNLFPRLIVLAASQTVLSSRQRCEPHDITTKTRIQHANASPYGH
jgi:hypothetical protein